MNIPHFDQWLGDWAMERERFLTTYQSLLGLDLKVHLQTGPDRAAEAAREQAQSNTIAVRTTGDQSANIEVIALHGLLMKSVPSGEQGTSTVLARRRVRQAAADSNIAAIALHISSPGGTVDGTEALAADIAAAAKQKPVYAYIDDLGASAAYWLASQANKVFANGTALVGSIGTYCVVYDVSGRAAQQGIKVHVVRAGEMKGQGEPGTEVSAELLTELQARVDARNEFFVRGVTAGRGFSPEKTKSLADGRVHIAAEALAKGLIDGVQSFEATITQLAAATTLRNKPSANYRSSSTMDSATTAAVNATAQPTEAAAAPVAAVAAVANLAALAAPLQPQAASLTELEAACPGAGSDFILAQLKAGATVAAAQTAYIVQVQKEKQELTTKLNERQTVTAEATKKVGADPLPVGNDNQTASLGGDAIAQWEERVEQLMADKKLTKPQANRHLAIHEPEQHAAYIAAYTKLNGPKVNPRRGAAV